MIAVDDLRKDLWVTVLRWHAQERPARVPYGFGHVDIPGQTVTYTPNEHVGVPLKVAGVSPPFVAAQILGKGSVFTLDTRLLELAVLEEQFVQAYVEGASQADPLHGVALEIDGSLFPVGVVDAFLQSRERCESRPAEREEPAEDDDGEDDEE